MLMVNHLKLPNGTSVSVNVPDKTIRVIQGPNGVGKSLLLRSLALLHSISFTSFEFEGAAVDSISPQQHRKRVLYVPPVPLDTAGTVATYFDYPHELAVHQPIVTRHEYQQVLQHEGLWNRDFSLLSSGEKQYVQLLRAFSLKPRLFLLDETMGNMDQARRAQVESILMKLVNDGSSALVISHDPTQPVRLAASFCHFSELVN